MKNPIIESRLNRMMAIKKDLLTKKKSERGNQLKEIDATIVRLKKWLADPVTHIPDPVPPKPEPKRIHFPKLNNAVAAMEAFGKALGRIDPGDRKTEQEIRDIVAKVQNNGIEFTHVFIDEAKHDDQIDAIVKAQHIAFQHKENVGKPFEMDATDTIDNPKGNGWREPRVENVHRVFRRMNGLD